MSQLEHPRWDEVAARCLACGNCTAVCPTCYCFDVVDEVSLNLNDGDRYRVWNYCQMDDFAKWLHAEPGTAQDPRSYTWIGQSIVNNEAWDIDWNDPGIHAAMTFWILHQVIHPFEDALEIYLHFHES